MLKMYGYIPAWGVPDVSPFVTKIDCYLRMVGLPYELVKLPQGDLPRPEGQAADDRGRWYDRLRLGLHRRLFEENTVKADAGMAPATARSPSP
jgi:hypothetical protein